MDFQSNNQFNQDIQNVSQSNVSCVQNELVREINLFVKNVQNLHNIYLLKQIIDLIMSSKDFIEFFQHIPEYIPNTLKENISLITSLQNRQEYLNQKQSYFNYLKKPIGQIIIPENKLWSAAKLLINSNSIKSLPFPQDKKILEICLNLKQKKHLSQFLKQMYQNGKLNQKQLEQQVNQMQLDGQSGFNLNTLISQILKTKPKQKPVFQRIKQNKNNLQIFCNQVIRISCVNKQNITSGRIQEIKLINNQVILKIFGQQYSQKVILLMNNYMISNVSVQKNIDILLGKQIKIRYQMTLKQNKQNIMLLENQYIYPNPQRITSETILEAGYYNIYKQNNFKKENGHNLIFSLIQPEIPESPGKKHAQSPTKENGFFSHQKIKSYKRKSKQYKFKMKYQNQNYAKLNQYNIINEKYKTQMRFQTFCKSYYVKKFDSMQFQFSTKQQSQNNISITPLLSEDKSYETLQKFKIIYKQQSALISNMNTLYKNIFMSILQYQISNSYKISQQEKYSILAQKLKDLQNYKAFDSDINNIIKKYKELNISKTKSQILFSSFNRANYIQMINKQSTLNIAKIISLMTQVQTILQKTIRGKSIISFIGSTGSGKSTTVNYFLGVQLEKFINEFGDQVVRLSQKDPASTKSNNASIGQKIGTSQTIYSQGHEMIVEKYLNNKKDKDNQLFKYEIMNTNLCDNPGFHDTRGSIYQICTNLSIDRAIHFCKQIRVIVLVLPYQAFIFDRANPVIQIFQTIKKRFPYLLNKQKNIFQSFYIIITKYTSDQQTQKFKQRLEKHVDQQKFNLERLQEKNEHNSFIQINESWNRFEIFKSLLQMQVNERIDFIQINNTIDRKRIIKKYLNCKQRIPKDEYVKTMSSDQMKKTYFSHLSQVTHSWTNLILNPYFQQFTKQNKAGIEIGELEKKINKTKYEKKQLQDKLLLTKEQLQKVKQTLEQNENYLNQIQNLQLGIWQAYNDKQCIQTERIYKKSQLERLETQLKQQKIKQEEYSITIEQVKFRISQIKIHLNKWNNQETDQKIYQLSFKEGDQIITSKSYSKNQRFKCVESGQNLPLSHIRNTHIVGKQKLSACKVLNIQRKYTILPNKQFDPNKYLQQKIYSIGNYTAKIEQNNVELQAVKLHNNGTKLSLSILLKFQKNNFPNLKIVHKIPVSQVFPDLIKNAQAMQFRNINEKRQLQQKIDQNKKQIQRLNNLIQKIKGQIIEKNKQLLKINEQIKLEKQKQDLLQKQNKNKQKVRKTMVLNSIDKIQEQIRRDEQNIMLCEQQIQKLQKRLKVKRADLQNIKFNHKRLALLIKNQLQKNIPQTLQKFIEIAFQLRKQNEQKSQTIKQGQNLQIKNFMQFLQNYRINKDLLPDLIKNHLCDTKEILLKKAQSQQENKKI